MGGSICYLFEALSCTKTTEALAAFDPTFLLPGTALRLEATLLLFEFDSLPLAGVTSDELEIVMTVLLGESFLRFELVLGESFCFWTALTVLLRVEQADFNCYSSCSYDFCLLFCIFGLFLISLSITCVSRF